MLPLSSASALRTRCAWASCAARAEELARRRASVNLLLDSLVYRRYLLSQQVDIQLGHRRAARGPGRCSSRRARQRAHRRRTSAGTHLPGCTVPADVLLWRTRCGLWLTVWRADVGARAGEGRAVCQDGQLLRPRAAKRWLHLRPSTLEASSAARRGATGRRQWLLGTHLYCGSGTSGSVGGAVG
eukprot:SAG31_NODE_471_length_15238_cov_14.684554_2_plen_185_part_00